MLLALISHKRLLLVLVAILPSILAAPRDLLDFPDVVYLGQTEQLGLREIENRYPEEVANGEIILYDISRDLSGTRSNLACDKALCLNPKMKGYPCCAGDQQPLELCECEAARGGPNGLSCEKEGWFISNFQQAGQWVSRKTCSLNAAL